jgi:hypothetical protein
LRYVGVGLIPIRQFEDVGNGLEAFLDAGLRAGMDPENPVFS